MAPDSRMARVRLSSSRCSIWQRLDDRPGDTPFRVSQHHHLVGGALQRAGEQTHGEPCPGGLAALASRLCPKRWIRLFGEITADRGSVGLPPEREDIGGFHYDVQAGEFAAASVNDGLEHFDDIV